MTNNDGSMGTSSGGVFGDAGPCDACAPGAIYVAPNGSDANPGTLDQPLQTLTKAKALVQPLVPKATSDLVVYLRGGTYPVTSTLTFGNADSGQNGHYVKYLAYPGERPIITGRPADHRMEAVGLHEQHLLGERHDDSLPAALRQRRQGGPRS